MPKGFRADPGDPVAMESFLLEIGSLRFDALAMTLAGEPQNVAQPWDDGPSFDVNGRDDDGSYPSEVDASPSTSWYCYYRVKWQQLQRRRPCPDISWVWPGKECRPRPSTRSRIFEGGCINKQRARTILSVGSPYVEDLDAQDHDTHTHFKLVRLLLPRVDVTVE